MMLRALLVAAGLAVLVLLPLGLKSYGIYLLSLWALNTVAAMGLNLTVGQAGQVSLAQAAFVAIGAYTAALLAPLGLGFWLALPLAVGVAFAVGLVVGFPALRVQHHHLAFVTLGFNALVILVLRNEEWLTGGTYGISGIERPDILGFSTFGALPFYYLCLGVLGAASLAMWWLLRSPWGRAFAGLRDNPLRAASLGVDVRAYTLLAFAIGSAYGGLSGAFLGPLVEYVDPTPFGLETSLALLLMVVVGGAGSFWGPFLGAALVTLLPEWLRVAEGFYLMLYALLVMVLMILCPSGLMGVLERLAGRLRRAS
ncbi:branched-chain amino acid ABC transporter permease [Geminicoccaceae bacterium 1502E]|nr:branched-chain amino acid ABC transporter permease [Geminicoccaceae bacterium 1502E]